MSASVSAQYYRSPDADSVPVSLSVIDRIVFVTGSGLARSAPLDTVRIAATAGTRVLTFSDRARCETEDGRTFDRLVDAPSAATTQWEGVPWRLIVVLALLGLTLVAAYRYAIPALARRVAGTVPAQVSRTISEETLAMLDAGTLQPTEIAAERRRQIEVAFGDLIGPVDEIPYRLVFRKSEPIGANAMALPSGDIVVTDALVSLARRDEEVLGVLAHEAGHIDHRHGLRLAVQSSALSATIFWLAGDLGSMMSLAPTALLNAKYSRDFEREADVYAADLLRARGISPSALADMLERLRADGRQRTGAAGDAAVFDYLASHPPTDERLAFLRSR